MGKNKGSKTKRKLSFLKDVRGNEIEVNEYKREYLQHEDTIKGPAIIREPMSTTFILEGQNAIVGKYGEIYIVKG